MKKRIELAWMHIEKRQARLQWTLQCCREKGNQGKEIWRKKSVGTAGKRWRMTVLDGDKWFVVCSICSTGSDKAYKSSQVGIRNWQPYVMLMVCFDHSVFTTFFASCLWPIKKLGLGTVCVKVYDEFLAVCFSKAVFFVIMKQ